MILPSCPLLVSTIAQCRPKMCVCVCVVCVSCVCRVCVVCVSCVWSNSCSTYALLSKSTTSLSRKRKKTKMNVHTPEDIVVCWPNQKNETAWFSVFAQFIMVDVCIDISLECLGLLSSWEERCTSGYRRGSDDRGAMSSVYLYQQVIMIVITLVFIHFLAKFTDTTGAWSGCDLTYTQRWRWARTLGRLWTMMCY